MLIKLALGNVRRSARDFSVYFMTLAFAVCLLYSFLASTDYLLALDLTAEQRLYYAKSGEVLVAFAVFVAVIFAFLIGYANVFLVRRRKREFGLYELLGMGHARVSCVLALESASVGIVSLIAGMALGVALSPLFGLVAAFVFGVPWTPVVTFSPAAAAQTALAFAAITVVAALRAVRSVGRCTLIELMRTDRAPERRVASGRVAVGVQRLLSIALLVLVWGVCLLAPGYFIVFIIPMGLIALGGTYFAFRVLAARVPERLRARSERYYSGLVPFTVRQVEARIESGCTALAAVCVLLAAGMCMIVAGLVFSVGLRSGDLFESAWALAPLAYACVFYGAAFMVAAAAVLALQQLSQAADADVAYRTLDRLGADAALVRSSVRAQVGASFAVPAVMACLHCLFGFALIFVLSIMFASEGFVLFAAATVGLTLAILIAYYLATSSTCIRALTRPSARR